MTVWLLDLQLPMQSVPITTDVGCMIASEVKKVFNSSAQLIGDRECKFLGTSALKGDGVHEGIEWIVECIKRNNIDRPPVQKEIT